MLITPSKPPDSWRELFDQAYREAYEDREAFEAYKITHAEYQRFRRAVLIWGIIMTIGTMAFVAWVLR